MTLTQNIPDATVKQIITGIMENFPEASNGCALRCVGWKYAALQFKFEDCEDGKTYKIGLPELTKAFALLFTDKWPKGCTQPPHSSSFEGWENWLCESDATDSDAFAQLACLGEVIYG